MNNPWPETETAIDLTGINGEVPTIPYKGLECRVNPRGNYALYWHKGSWRESASITNDDILAEGVQK